MLQSCAFDGVDSTSLLIKQCVLRDYEWLKISCRSNMSCLPLCKQLTGLQFQLTREFITRSSNLSTCRIRQLVCVTILLGIRLHGICWWTACYSITLFELFTGELIPWWSRTLNSPYTTVNNLDPYVFNSYSSRHLWRKWNMYITNKIIPWYSRVGNELSY